MSVFLINPFLVQAPVITSRIFFDAGFSTTITATTTTPTAVRTLSTTETAGKNYVAFWHAILSNQSTSVNAIARLFESPDVRQLFEMESQDAADDHSVGGAYAYAGGTNRTFTLDGYEAANATNDIQDYSLSVLELDDTDLFQTQTASSNSTTSTYTTRVSVTLQSGFDYLIIASAGLEETTTNASTIRVFDGTTAYGENSRNYGQQTANRIPYFHVVKLTGSDQTVSLQWARSGATGTATIFDASIIALRLDKFPAYWYQEQPTEQTTTSTTTGGATGTTLSATGVNSANYHILIGCAQINNNNGATTGATRLFNTGQSVSYAGTHRREPNNVAEYYPTIVARIVTLTGSTENIAWQFWAIGGNTARIRNMAIALLDTGVSVP